MAKVVCMMEPVFLGFRLWILDFRLRTWENAVKRANAQSNFYFSTT